MHRSLVALAALVLALAGPARAVLLPSNTSVLLPTGTTLADRPELAGQVIEDVSTPFSFFSQSVYGSGFVTGTVESMVVRETASGTLDFYWRVINAPSSFAGMNMFIVNDFAGPYDADWRADSLGTAAPQQASWPGPAVGEVIFQFTADPGFIEPGGSSFLLLLHTDATQYALTATYRVNTVQHWAAPDPADFYATFAPAAAVPEPQSLALFAVGLLMTSWVVRARARGRSHCACGSPPAA